MEKQYKQAVSLPLTLTKDNEQKYKRIFEQAMDGILLWDHDHMIIDVNQAGEKMFGVSKERLIGHQFNDPTFFFSGNKLEILVHFAELLQKGHMSSTIILEEDSQKRYFEYSSKLDILDGVNFTVFKEVTEKVNMEEQLRKAETLNVIGELAAGIAHEIRNPMTALKGFIQLLENSIKEEHSLYYQVITSELERIDSIINEFLILAKPQVIKFQEEDIVLLMNKTLELLNAQAVLHNIQFVTQFEDDLPFLFCEPNQLKKVFINLIKNAIEVMPNGGHITISIKKQKAQRILISIRDEGKGIAKEKLNKLGEPFYTTKDHGTGLGLMVSYRIIAEHQGTITLESELGKGTIFYIELPLNLKNKRSKVTING